MGNPNPVITHPPDKSKQNPKTRDAYPITWDSMGLSDVRRWWLCVGTKAGKWDIRDCDMGDRLEEYIDADHLPKSSKVWFQVLYEVVDSTHGEPEIGETEMRWFETK